MMGTNTEPKTRAARRSTKQCGDDAACTSCSTHEARLSVHLSHRELLDLYGALTELSSRSRVPPEPGQFSPGADHMTLVIALNRRGLRDHADALDDARTSMINELSGGVGVVTDTLTDEETGETRINPRAIEFRERYRRLLMESAGWFTLHTVDYEALIRHSRGTCNASAAQPCSCRCHDTLPPTVIEGLLPILVGRDGERLHTGITGDGQ